MMVMVEDDLPSVSSLSSCQSKPGLVSAGRRPPTSLSAGTAWRRILYSEPAASRSSLAPGPVCWSEPESEWGPGGGSILSWWGGRTSWLCSSANTSGSQWQLAWPAGIGACSTSLRRWRNMKDNKIFPHFLFNNSYCPVQCSVQSTCKFRIKMGKNFQIS